jgi:hypothetical protein
VNCPPDAYVEGEACGGDTNGGCNMGTPAFEPIACGDTVCGTVWANGGIRDTDWYEVVTAGDTQLTWTVEAELPIVIGLVDFNNPGSGECNDTTGYLNPFTTGSPCDQVNITTECLPAGTYWLFVAPQDFDNLPCDSNSDYVATLTCQGCVIPAPDIRIEPNQLNFDCNSLGGASSSIHIIMAS